MVFAHVSDPVAAGFVKSFAHPGTNLTGVADFVGELQEKRVQVFSEMVRLLTRAAMKMDRRRGLHEQAMISRAHRSIF